MANDVTPPQKENAPDPARTYERAKPEAESGMGRLDADPATPEPAPDRMEQAISNEQAPRQINAAETDDARRSAPPAPPAVPKQPDHSMHDEEPTDPDFAPADIHDPRRQRHPRREGKGGTP